MNARFNGRIVSGITEKLLVVCVILQYQLVPFEFWARRCSVVEEGNGSTEIHAEYGIAKDHIPLKNAKCV